MYTAANLIIVGCSFFETFVYNKICLQEKLPPTDSRLRPDQRYLENGEYEMANSEKLRLEQRQRQVNRVSHLILSQFPVEFFSSYSDYGLSISLFFVVFG